MRKILTHWLNIDKQSLNFLTFLFMADIGFMLLHLLHLYTNLLPARTFSLEYDGSYAEWFQYIKYIWIIGIWLFLFWRTTTWIYAAWVFVFMYLLLDDSLFIHERLGEYIAKEFNYPYIFGLRPLDTGELTVIAIIGSICLGLLVLTYRRASPSAKIISRSVFVLWIAIGFFGVVVDAFHSKYLYYPWAAEVGLIEDAGEMLCVSLICWYMFTKAQIIDPESYL